jgi:hypothetical protein
VAYLAGPALVGKQSTNKAEKAYDVTVDLSADLLAGTGPNAGGHDGARVQVKSRSVSPKPRAGQLQTSPFHADGFDFLALVMHEASDYAIRQAVLLPVKTALAYARPVSARRDDVLRLSMTPRVMSDPTAIDITKRVRSVAVGPLATMDLARQTGQSLDYRDRLGYTERPPSTATGAARGVLDHE